jgi:hypothetical protein
MTQRQTFKVKEVDDILGGEEAWENVDQTDGKVHDGIILVFFDSLNAIILHHSFLFLVKISHMSEPKVRIRKGLLLYSPDPKCGRTIHRILQMCQMRLPMECQ